MNAELPPVPGNGLSEAAIEQACALLRRAGRDRRVLADLQGHGPVAALEAACIRLLQVPYAVAVSSGSAALQAALLACDVGPGDEVIVSPYGWGQTVAAGLSVGATPVFADVDPVTGNLDPECVQEWIGPQTKAVLPTHLFGCPLPMDRFERLCQAHGLDLITDAAQALGAQWLGRPVAAWGDCCCFSFGPGKPVSAGEGGLVTCRDTLCYERILLVGQHPLRTALEIENPQLRASITDLNMNHRLGALAAILAQHELDRLGDRLAHRHALVRQLKATLSGVAGVQVPADPQGGRHALQHVVLHVAEALSDDALAGMQKEGLPVRRGPVTSLLCARPPFLPGSAWTPRALQPRTRAHPSWRPEATPHAARLCTRALWFDPPQGWEAVTEADITRWCDCLRRHLAPL